MADRSRNVAETGDVKCSDCTFDSQKHTLYNIGGSGEYVLRMSHRCDVGVNVVRNKDWIFHRF